MSESRDDVKNQITDRSESISKRPHGSPSGLARFFTQKAPLGWLTFITAVASTIATGLSYQAAEKSSATATQAQEFSERTQREQIALARPVLSVMSGQLSTWNDDSRYNRKTHRLELAIHNSGTRSALPAWIGLFRKSGFSDFRKSGNNAWHIDTKIADIPSDSSVKVVFYLSEPDTEWILGLAYADELPSRGSPSDSTQQPLKPQCSSAKVILLSATLSTTNTDDTSHEWTITTAQPVAMNRSEMIAKGPTYAEAVGLYMEETLKRDERCIARDTR